MALSSALHVAGVDSEIITGGLTSKVAAINQGSFDLAVEPHFNADADHLDPDDFDDTRGHGCMVMYCPGNNARQKQAAIISAALSATIGNRDLGAREGWYWGGSAPGTIADYFLRKTNCPAFIPEPGYIDNNKFTKEWLIAERHTEIAQALCAGILAVLGVEHGNA